MRQLSLTASRRDRVPKISAAGTDVQVIRYDLQGLRGVGVLLVVIGHLWQWPSGAFAALDVFFVLSGYFITSVLLDKHRKRGSIELPEFYLGRVRRLMPTALTVIGVTILLTSVLYSPARAEPVKTEGFWAGVFGSNWYFADQGVDYFADLTDGSPLLHYWSLSVEEQFYFVWPFLLLAVLAVSVRRFRGPTPMLFVVFGALTAASFIYSLWHSQASPTGAYFSTLDRAWEFGVGGLVAVGRPALRALSVRTNRILMWTAVVLIVMTLGHLGQGTAYPAPWGLLPVCGVAALIASGVSGNASPPRFLTTVPLVYLGTISYSLYLWHMPVNFLTRSHFVQETSQYRITALAITMVVSVLSFHLLERPARRSRYLMTARERRRLRSKAPLNWRPVQVGWGCLALVVTLALATAAVVRTDEPIEAVAPSIGSSPLVPPSAAPATAADVQSQRVRDALAQRTFPEFVPPLSDLSWENLVEKLANVQCLDVTFESAPSCRFEGDSDRTVVLLGDSFATAYLPGIRAALRPHGWTVQQFTMGECPTWTLPEYRQSDGSRHPECEKRQQEAGTLLKKLRPDLLILSSAGSPYLAYKEFFYSQLSDHDFARKTLAQTLTRLAPLAGGTVVLQPPPRHMDLLDCVTRFSEPRHCVTRIAEGQLAGDAGERQAATDSGVEYVATEAWFCYEQQCPAFMGSTPVKAGGHLSVEFSESLASVLGEALHEAE